MKYLSKLILIALPLCLCAFGADESGKNPGVLQEDKHVLSITAFSLKSSDGKLDAKMDRQGRILLDGKHIATANAAGEIKTPGGELLLQVKVGGEVKPDVMGVPVKVTQDGTLTGAGETHAWVDGKFDLGDKGHMEIVPKDSPSKKAATLMFLMLSADRVPAP